MGSLERLFSGWHDSAIATLVGAAITFIGSMVGIWLKDRNIDQRHVQYLDKASKYLAFWEQHHRIQQLVCVDDDPERGSILQGKLNAAAEFVNVSVTLRGRREFRTQVQPHSRLRRWLLLYKPVNWWAWLPRIYFYPFVVSLVVCPEMAIIAVLEKEWALLAVSCGLFVFYATGALGFRVLSRLIEGPRPLTVSDWLLAKQDPPAPS